MIEASAQTHARVFAELIRKLSVRQNSGPSQTRHINRVIRTQRRPRLRIRLIEWIGAANVRLLNRELAVLRRAPRKLPAKVLRHLAPVSQILALGKSWTVLQTPVKSWKRFPKRNAWRNVVVDIPLSRD